MSIPCLHIRLDVAAGEVVRRQVSGETLGLPLPQGVEGLRAADRLYGIPGDPSLADIAGKWRAAAPAEPPWGPDERRTIGERLTRALLGELSETDLRPIERHGLEIWIESPAPHLLRLPWGWMKAGASFLEDRGVGIRVSSGDVERDEQGNPRVLVVRPRQVDGGARAEIPGRVLQHLEDLERALGLKAPSPFRRVHTRAQAEAALEAGFTGVVVVHGSWERQRRRWSTEPHLLMDASDGETPSTADEADPWALSDLQEILRKHEVSLLHVHDTAGRIPLHEVIERLEPQVAALTWSQDDPSMWAELARLPDDDELGEVVEGSAKAVASYLKALICEGRPPALARAAAFRWPTTAGAAGGAHSKLRAWTVPQRTISPWHFRESQLIELDRSRQSERIMGALRKVSRGLGPSIAFLWHAEEGNGPQRFHDRLALELTAWSGSQPGGWPGGARRSAAVWAVRVAWPHGPEETFEETLEHRYQRALGLGSRGLSAWVDRAFDRMRQREAQHLYLSVGHAIECQPEAPSAEVLQRFLTWWREVFLAPLLTLRKVGDPRAEVMHIHPVVGLGLWYRGDPPEGLSRDPDKADPRYQAALASFVGSTLLVEPLGVLSIVTEDDLVEFFAMKGSEGQPNWPAHWGESPDVRTRRRKAAEILEGTGGQWAKVLRRLDERVRL